MIRVVVNSVAILPLTSIIDIQAELCVMNKDSSPPMLLFL